MPYTILEKDEAKYHYPRGTKLPNFPMGRFDNDFDDLLIRKGVNVCRERKDDLFARGVQEFPDMADENLAVNAYFQLRHLNPSFIYDKVQDTAWLIYPVFDSENYFGIETNAATMKTMLEKEIRLNDDRRKMVIGKNLKAVDGIPAKLIHEGYEHLKMTQHIFEQETEIQLENVRDLYNDEATSVERMTKFNQSTEMLYRSQYVTDPAPDRNPVLIIE